MHIRHIADVPSRYVLVEGGFAIKGVGHVGHPRHVPVFDVAVGGDGRGLVGKPEIPGCVKISVGERRGLGL